MGFSPIENRVLLEVGINTIIIYRVYKVEHTNTNESLSVLPDVTRETSPKEVTLI